MHISNRLSNSAYFCSKAMFPILKLFQLPAVYNENAFHINFNIPTQFSCNILLSITITF